MSAGVVVWFTGLPASGKSTVALHVAELLRARRLPVEILDGTEVRQSLSRGLGFTPEDREEHVRRIGYVAKLLARNGVVALCASVSPYRATRDEIRARVVRFVEVFVDCPVDVAEARDRKGMYRRARAGLITDFTGVDAPYEPPDRPEVHIRSDREAPAVAAAAVVRTLDLLHSISAEPPDAPAPVGDDDVRRRLAGLGYA